MGRGGSEKMPLNKITLCYEKILFQKDKSSSLAPPGVPSFDMYKAFRKRHIIYVMWKRM